MSVNTIQNSGVRDQEIDLTIVPSKKIFFWVLVYEIYLIGQS